MKPRNRKHRSDDNSQTGNEQHEQEPVRDKLQIISNQSLKNHDRSDEPANEALAIGIDAHISRPVPQTPATTPKVGPALILVPDAELMDPHLVTFHEYNPAASERYRNLAISLISVARRRNVNRVLLASAQHGEGRTCVILNLASSLSQAGQRVLVVDTDLHRPSILRLLGIDTNAEVFDMMEKSPLDSALVRILPADFEILVSRPDQTGSIGLLLSFEFQEMLRYFSEDYDFILFDSPPLLTNTDAHLLLPLVDTTMLVVRPGMSSPAQMARALMMFNKNDLCGVVMNRSES